MNPPVLHRLYAANLCGRCFTFYVRWWPDFDGWRLYLRVSDPRLVKVLVDRREWMIYGSFLGLDAPAFYATGRII